MNTVNDFKVGDYVKLVSAIITDFKTGLPDFSGQIFTPYIPLIGRIFQVTDIVEDVIKFEHDEITEYVYPWRLELVENPQLDQMVKQANLVKQTNDGKSICIFCGGKTKKIDTGFNHWNICTVCGR